MTTIAEPEPDPAGAVHDGVPLHERASRAGPDVHGVLGQAVGAVDALEAVEPDLQASAGVHVDPAGVAGLHGGHVRTAGRGEEEGRALHTAAVDRPGCHPRADWPSRTAATRRRAQAGTTTAEQVRLGRWAARRGRGGSPSASGSARRRRRRRPRPRRGRRPSTDRPARRRPAARRQNAARRRRRGCGSSRAPRTGRPPAGSSRPDGRRPTSSGSRLACDGATRSTAPTGAGNRAQPAAAAACCAAARRGDGGQRKDQKGALRHALALSVRTGVAGALERRPARSLVTDRHKAASDGT